MRGGDQQQSGMFSYVSLEERVPQDHALRRIRETVDEILRGMAKDFDWLYAKTGRPAVPNMATGQADQVPRSQSQINRRRVTRGPLFRSLFQQVPRLSCE